METEKKNKTDSRKFIVWLSWLIISVTVLVLGIIAVVITSTRGEGVVELIEKVLEWFFAVSMMYLGMNVGQKLGYAFADSLLYNKEKEENNE